MGSYRTRDCGRRTPTAATWLALCVVLGACAPNLARPMIGMTPISTADTYTCLLAAVGRAGYRVVDADSDAGFLFAERQTDAPDFLDVGRYAWDEITFVVVPGVDGGSEVQATLSRSTQEDGEARTGSTGAGHPEVLDELLSACNVRASPADASEGPMVERGR